MQISVGLRPMQRVLQFRHSFDHAAYLATYGGGATLKARNANHHQTTPARDAGRQDKSVIGGSAEVEGS
jgi:hypothetical protein